MKSDGPNEIPDEILPGPLPAGVERLHERFSSGFSTAHSVLVWSNVVKLLSVILGSLCLLPVLIDLVSHYSLDGFTQVYVVLFAVAGFVAGVVMAASGHLLGATIIAAVNTSPLATDQEKYDYLSSLSSSYQEQVSAPRD
jgi:hypothetical protein